MKSKIFGKWTYPCYNIWSRTLSFFTENLMLKLKRLWSRKYLKHHHNETGLRLIRNWRICEMLLKPIVTTTNINISRSTRLPLLYNFLFRYRESPDDYMASLKYKDSPEMLAYNICIWFIVTEDGRPYKKSTRYMHSGLSINITDS